MKYEETALPHVFLCLLCHGHGVFFLDHAYLGHDHDHALYVENDLGHDFWKGTSGQLKWKACPVSARSRFTHRTIPLILVYTLAMKSHRTLFSSLNIDIYTFFKHASPFSVFTASVPISVSTSMWITIAFPIFITTAKLAIVVSRTLAALPAHGTRESLAESRGKPATHASVPRHAGRMSHHWVKSLGWICKVTMVTIADVLLII